MEAQERERESQAATMPEDVAILYAWANLHGASYRDFSASRREDRARIRLRAAESLRERELKAAADAGASAIEAELEAEDAADRPDADAARDRAQAKRTEASRRTAAAAQAGKDVNREKHEIAEAHASAERQAMHYAESEARRRDLAGPQPREMRDAYKVPFAAEASSSSSLAMQLLSDLRDPEWDNPETRDPEPDRMSVSRALKRAAAGGLDLRRTIVERSGPAWLYAPTHTPAPMPGEQVNPVAPPLSSFTDTLRNSGDRLTAQWLALQGVFDETSQEAPAVQPARDSPARTPLLLVFSLNRGAGNTSLVATLGRALSSLGERVVLTDTTPHGLLPLYFGAREFCPGVLRMVQPSNGGTEAPVFLVSYDAERVAKSDRQEAALAEEILRNGEQSQRVVLDLSESSGWIIPAIVNLHPVVLVPIAPDMNSVLSLEAMERFFEGIADADGRPLLPFYVMNQFNDALPLHLDVREVFRRQLGKRLLDLVIRRSPSVGEAFVEGMTVFDYKPDAPVSQDYLDAAAWLRTISPAAVEASRRASRGEP